MIETALDNAGVAGVAVFSIWIVGKMLVSRIDALIDRVEKMTDKMIEVVVLHKHDQ